MMVASNESLYGEDLVSSERAEDMGDPQCLRIAMEDNIGSGYSAERNQCLMFISIPINIGPEQEPVR